MRISFTFFGYEVWSLELSRSSCGCVEADEEDYSGIRGGETHDFERDTAPLDPTDHYGEWEDRARFGFGSVT